MATTEITLNNQSSPCDTTLHPLEQGPPSLTRLQLLRNYAVWSLTLFINTVLPTAAFTAAMAGTIIALLTLLPGYAVGLIMAIPILGGAIGLMFLTSCTSLSLTYCICPDALSLHDKQFMTTRDLHNRRTHKAQMEAKKQRAERQKKAQAEQKQRREEARQQAHLQYHRTIKQLKKELDNEK